MMRPYHPFVMPWRLWRSLEIGCGSLWLILSVWLAVAWPQSQTEIVSDNTLDTVVTPQDGGMYDITGGYRPENGPNLFHSFERFSIGRGDTASFRGPAGINNILSRVTGGQPSLIDGRIRSQLPGANLYLINPSGVIFGPGGRLDLQGSFHVSTADVLRLADGAVFAADVGRESMLTISAPVNFGFLRDRPASIRLEGARLRVPDGQTLSIIGGDISLGMVDRSPQRPLLQARGGRIHLVSRASAGAVVLASTNQPPVIDTTCVMCFGDIHLSDEARLDVSAGVIGPSGAVIIRSGHLRMDHLSRIQVTARTSDAPDVAVDIVATQAVHMTNAASIVSQSGGTTGPASGNAGAVQIRTPMLFMEDRVSITTRALGSGHGGDIELNVGRLLLSGGARLDTSTSGAGHAGAVTIIAIEEVELSGRSIRSSGISSSSNAGNGTGSAGRILIRAPMIRLSDSTTIDTRALGSGRAGIIELIDVAALIMTDDAQIRSDTDGPGPAGEIHIQANAIHLQDRSRMVTQTTGAGDAGAVTLDMDQLQLTDEAAILSRTSGAGAGGTVTILARELIHISGQNSGLFTDASRSGTGGDIVMSAKRVELSDAATLSAMSSGAGNAGHISLTTTEMVMNGNSTISTASQQADGGNIDITTNHLMRLHDSAITTTVEGGPMTTGGNLTINGNAIVLVRSQLRANAFEGRGGQITIRADVVLADPLTTISASASSPIGLDGIVDIQAPVANLSGTLTPLSRRFAVVQLLPTCADHLADGQPSQLVINGRDSVPVDPDGLLPSPLYQETPPVIPSSDTTRGGQGWGVTRPILTAAQFLSFLGPIKRRGCFQTK